MARCPWGWSVLLIAPCGVPAGAAELVAYPVCTADGKQEQPDIDGDTVVWVDHRNGDADIYGYDLKTKREFPICTAAGHQRSPVVCGHVVGWLDGGVTADVFGRPWVADLESGVTAQLAADVGGRSQSLVLSPNWAVWLHHERLPVADGAAERLRIHACKLDGSAEGDIAATDARTYQEGGFGFHFLGDGPAISPDDVVVWQDRREGRSELRAHNLRTNADRALLRVEDVMGDLATDGSTVAWLDGRMSGFMWGIYACDLATGAESPVYVPPSRPETLPESRSGSTYRTALWCGSKPASAPTRYPPFSWTSGPAA